MLPFSIITNLFQQPTTIPEQLQPRNTTSSNLTLSDLAGRLHNMEKKYEEMPTKVWQLGEQTLFLDDELRRLRAGEPSRRLPSRGIDPDELDDVDRLFKR